MRVALDTNFGILCRAETAARSPLSKLILVEAGLSSIYAVSGTEAREGEREGRRVREDWIEGEEIERNERGRGKQSKRTKRFHFTGLFLVPFPKDSSNLKLFVDLLALKSDQTSSKTFAR